MHSSTHLAAIIMLLVGTQDGVHSHRHASRGQGGRHRFNAWPSTFISNDLDSGAFRPFQACPRGGGVFTSGAPLVDVFQEVMGDIKKGKSVRACYDVNKVWSGFVLDLYRMISYNRQQS